MIIKVTKNWKERKKRGKEKGQTPKPHMPPKIPKIEMSAKSPCRKIILFEVAQLSVLQTQM